MNTIDSLKKMTCAKNFANNHDQVTTIPQLCFLQKAR